MNILPCFTPEELEMFGVHNSDKDENFYHTVSKSDNIGWYDLYKTTGQVDEEYYNRVDEAYKSLLKCGDDVEDIAKCKQALLDLGWNPEVRFSKDSIDKAYEITKSKLEESGYLFESLDIESI